MRHVAMALICLVVVCLLAGQAVGEQVALVINGGYGFYNNNAGFSSQMQKWYPTLTGAGYRPENIYVLDSDGRDNDYPVWGDVLGKDFGNPWIPTQIRYDAWLLYETGSGRTLGYVDSPKGFYDNTTSVREATEDGFDLTTYEMSQSGSPDDELLVVLINHGGVDAGQYSFGIWDYLEVGPGSYISFGAKLDGGDMAGYIDRVPYDKRLFVVSTCYAAALWQDVGNDRTAMMAACGADELAWMQTLVLQTDGPGPLYPLMPGDGWPFAVIDGVTQSETWAEVFQYSYDNDIFGPVLGPYDTGTSYGWVTEYPELIDPSGLTTDWIIVQFMPGDANKDGVVDLDDFGILKANFGSGTLWEQGNFDRDGDVDLDDFGILKNNLGTGGMMIPEPATAVLVVFGALLLVCRRR